MLASHYGLWLFGVIVSYRIVSYRIVPSLRPASAHLLWAWDVGPDVGAWEQMRMLVGAVHNALVRYLRRLAGARNYGPGGIANMDVYQLTGCLSLRKHLLQLRIKYLGHVARIPDSCSTKHIALRLFWHPECRPPPAPWGGRT